jgi:hypothetical protein
MYVYFSLFCCMNVFFFSSVLYNTYPWCYKHGLHIYLTLIVCKFILKDDFEKKNAPHKSVSICDTIDLWARVPAALWQEVYTLCICLCQVRCDLIHFFRRYWLMCSVLSRTQSRFKIKRKKKCEVPFFFFSLYTPLIAAKRNDSSL